MNTTTLSTPTSPSVSTSADRQLRLALVVDAVISGANALGYVALGWALDNVLGIPSGGLVAIGCFLAVYTAFAAIVASRRALPNAGVTAVIEANVAWVVASVAVVAVGAFDLTGVGTAWVLAQAAVVAGFAFAQVRSRR